MDITHINEDKIEEIAENMKKQEELVKIAKNAAKNTTKPLIQTLKNDEIEIFTALYRRVTVLEMDVQLMKDKLFTPSTAVKGQEKLSTYGKEVKKRLQRSSL